MTRHIQLFVVLIVAVAMWPVTLRADSPRDTKAMAATNTLYESGQYLQAALIYEQIIDQGYEDATLYYNLGNAYFKQGDLGRAILSYRRAELIYPRSADIRTNLKIARSQRRDILNGDENQFDIETTISPVRHLTLDELAQLTLIIWFMLVLLAMVILYAKNPTVRKSAVYAFVVVGMALLLSAGAMGHRWYSQDAEHEVVVVADVVDVVSGPGTSYVKEFTLHSGVEARLLEHRGSWTRISLPQSDRRGWVPSIAVEGL